MERTTRHTLSSLLHLYWLHARLIARTNVMKGSGFVAISLAVLLREALAVAAAFAIVHRFTKLRGWSASDLLLLYSFLYLSYAFVALLFTGVRDFDAEVSEGECDAYFVRPLGVLYQVIARKADYAATWGHGALGIGLFIYAATQVNVDWTALNVLHVAASLVGGVLVQAAMLLVSAAASFWMVRTTNIRNLLFFNVRRCVGFPLSVYPDAIKWLTVYVVPFGFVSYFPAQYLLKRADGYDFPFYYSFGAPLVGVVMFCGALAIWRRGLLRYAGAGS